MLVFKLKTHKPGEPTPQFYIQCKGLHSGRPLRKPIPNCFSVYCETPDLFGYVYALYIGGFFRFYIRGSVVPFITIEETKQLLTDHSGKIGNNSMFQQIMDIGELINAYKAKIKLFDQMRQAISHQALK